MPPEENEQPKLDITETSKDGSKNNTPEVAKDNADKAAIQETKWELGDLVSMLTQSLEQELIKKYGAENSETTRILDKVKDLAKVGMWLKIKWAINSVVGFFGIVKKWKPDFKIPTALTDMQEKITPAADKLDEVEKQIDWITSGKVLQDAMMESQGINTTAEAWQSDKNLDTVLSNLELQAKALKEQKNVTALSYKMWFAKLLQQFVNDVKNLKQPVEQNQNGNAQNTETEWEYDDEDIYENTAESTIGIDAKEFAYTAPLGMPIVWMKESDVTSKFWHREKPNAKATSEHKWIDIGMPLGTEIVSPAPGKVISVKEQKDSSGKSTWAGKYVEIDHGDFITRYFHVSTQDVAEWDIVKAWQKIATVGNTGNSTGPHLHYEIRDKKVISNANKKTASQYVAVNPEDFWDFDGDGKVVAMKTYKKNDSTDNKTVVA